MQLPKYAEICTKICKKRQICGSRKNKTNMHSRPCWWNSPSRKCWSKADRDIYSWSGLPSWIRNDPTWPRFCVFYRFWIGKLKFFSRKRSEFKILQVKIFPMRLQRLCQLAQPKRCAFRRRSCASIMIDKSSETDAVPSAKMWASKPRKLTHRAQSRPLLLLVCVCVLFGTLKCLSVPCTSNLGS